MGNTQGGKRGVGMEEGRMGKVLVVVCHGLVDLQSRDWRLLAYNMVVEKMKCSMGR